MEDIKTQVRDASETIIIGDKPKLIDVDVIETEKVSGKRDQVSGISLKPKT